MKILKVILINTLVTFLLLEGGSRIYYALSADAAPHRDHSVVREWRWVSQRLKDGKTTLGEDYEHDALVGWRNAPNIRRGDLVTNSHGMRNEREFAFEPVNGRPRLLIVGDSYSFGHGVRNEETFAYLLGENLPEWDVMNMAVEGHGTDQSYIMYEQYGESLRPEIVLVGFFVRDFNRNTFSYREYAKPRYVPQPDGSMLLTHSPVQSPQALIEEYRSGDKRIGGWRYSYAVASIQRVLNDRVKRDHSEGSLPRRTLTGIMEMFVRRVRDNGATPVWIIIPSSDIETGSGSGYDDVEEFAEAEARRLDMPVLRLQPILRDHLRRYPDVALWRAGEVGGHFSAAGHRLTADSIHEFLESEDLLRR